MLTVDLDDRHEVCQLDSSLIPGAVVVVVFSAEYLMMSRVHWRKTYTAICCRKTMKAHVCGFSGWLFHVRY